MTVGRSFILYFVWLVRTRFERPKSSLWLHVSCLLVCHHKFHKSDLGYFCVKKEVGTQKVYHGLKPKSILSLTGPFSRQILCHGWMSSSEGAMLFGSASSLQTTLTITFSAMLGRAQDGLHFIAAKMASRLVIRFQLYYFNFRLSSDTYCNFVKNA